MQASTHARHIHFIGKVLVAFPARVLRSVLARVREQGHAKITQLDVAKRVEHHVAQGHCLEPHTHHTRRHNTQHGTSW